MLKGTNASQRMPCAALAPTDPDSLHGHAAGRLFFYSHSRSAAGTTAATGRSACCASRIPRGGAPATLRLSTGWATGCWQSARGRSR